MDDNLPDHLTTDAWIDATISDPLIRPAAGYMRAKYVLEHLSAYLKWLEVEYGKSCPFAFTLTTNITDAALFPEEEQKMVLAATKILSQQTNTVKEGEAYLEYTTNGAPHIHGWYKTEKGGRIYAKIFKRHWNLWNEDIRIGKGHQGGYHEKQKSANYNKYASAEGRLIYKV